MICLISLITCEKFYTFAPQSRAFLSQLSVTGDESGFFYVLPPRPALEIMPMALVFCHSFVALTFCLSRHKSNTSISHCQCFTDILVQQKLNGDSFAKSGMADGIMGFVQRLAIISRAYALLSDPPTLASVVWRCGSGVVFIHFCGERVKAFSPASFLNPSNSRGLKPGLYKVSQIPKYSIVLRLRIQLPITAVGSSLL